MGFVLVLLASSFAGYAATAAAATAATAATATAAGDRAYAYLSYAEVVARMEEMKATHPLLVDLYDAQTRYGLPNVGRCSAPGAQPSVPCRQVIMEIGNRGKATSGTPEIFLSGALHGNEVIGPTAMVELAAFLLDRYGKDPILTHLVDTRRITVFPTPNAVGYFRKERGEMKEDPNRDFGFDTDPGKCMRTVAGRSVNEGESGEGSRAARWGWGGAWWWSWW
jgi:hypothetical protein